VTLNNNLGGPVGFGMNSLPGNDDGSTAVINLAPAFPNGLHFFGHTYMQAYLNNNGNISFGGAYYQFTAQSFPLSGTAFPYPMIAPYWTDIDTRASAQQYHNLLWWDLRAGQLTATWYDVGYFDAKYDHRMSFQMIIRNSTGCGTGDFDVEFRYNTCGFTTGDVSGGTDGHGGTCAQVGFDAHDGTNYVSIPESLHPAVENVCVMSNVGTPGIYQFQVRGGSVVCAGGGQVCTVGGQHGACAVGVNACRGSGVTCIQVIQPGTETCDLVDNDCDNMVDEGLSCGNCEFCDTGASCVMDPSSPLNGQCVDDACTMPSPGAMCPEGQRCVRASNGPPGCTAPDANHPNACCVDACTGVTCPHGQQCIAGQCLDLCMVITCDAGYVCQNSQCVAQCPCNACPTGQTCNSDGSCTPMGCDIVSCPTGMYCDMNAQCADSCTGVTCPANQACMMGNCVSTAGMDAGVPPPTDGAASSGDAAPGNDSGVHRTDANAGGDAGHTGPHVTHAGCACRVERGGAPASAALVLFGLVLGLRRRRIGGR
jgi:MYXO-CTERM domain-containing protein